MTISQCSALQNQLYQTGLALDDTQLYLDTHPCDTQALAYYQKIRAMYQAAVQSYESQCGPLFATNSCANNYWNWLQDTWPWEGGCR